MLVECGFTRAIASNGSEFTFRPSLGRIAALGSPTEIVELFAALHGPNAEKTAPLVLAGLCDQDDLSPLIGEPEATPTGVQWRGGEMSLNDRVVIARHLMQHGICGKQRADGKPASPGKFSDRFDAAEYVAAARAHLGMSSQDAEALSMTELQLMLEMKFPELAEAKADVPTREEYEAAMKAFEERQRG